MMERRLWVGAVVWLVRAVHREGEKKVRDELTCAYDAPVRRGGLGPAFSTSAWSGGRPPLRTPGWGGRAYAHRPNGRCPHLPLKLPRGGEPPPPKGAPGQEAVGDAGERVEEVDGEVVLVGPLGPAPGRGGGGLVGQAYRGNPHECRVNKVG